MAKRNYEHVTKLQRRDKTRLKYSKLDSLMITPEARKPPDNLKLYMNTIDHTGEFDYRDISYLQESMHNLPL